MTNQDVAQDLVNVIAALNYTLSSINYKTVDVKRGQVVTTEVGTTLVLAYDALNNARDLYLKLPKKYEEVLRG
jgi:hypothetical protein